MATFFFSCLHMVSSTEAMCDSIVVCLFIFCYCCFFCLFFVLLFILLFFVFILLLLFFGYCLFLLLLLF